MKKVLNILLILLACFSINVSAANGRDVTDNSSCEPGVTYYNYYFFNAAEHLSMSAHTDYTRPYDFFTNTSNYYSVSCAGAINLTSSQENGGRLQTVENPSTCTGTVDDYNLNTWSVVDFWSTVNKISSLYFADNHTSEDGWTANEENYIFKRIGDEEIRFIIPGTSASSWNGATYQKLKGVTKILGEKPTLLPKTNVELYFDQPNAVVSYFPYTTSGDTSLGANYIGKYFKGSSAAKKFIVTREKPTISSTYNQPCNSTNSPGHSCQYEYYSPVMYVMEYTCSAGTPPPRCNPETACCYEKEEKPVNELSNNLAQMCKNPIYSWTHPIACGANSISDALTGSAGTAIDGKYNETYSGYGAGKYTYTQKGYFTGEYHSKSNNLVLTECVPSCNPESQCCYVRSNQGLAGFLNAAEASTDMLTNIIQTVNNSIGVTSFLNQMKGLFGADFSGAKDPTEIAKETANSLIDQALGGSGAAAKLKYQYKKELPKNVNITVSLAASGGSKSIQVPDTTGRYRAWLLNSNGERVKQISIEGIDNTTKVEMESCGCNPEWQCCYDSTGITYSGYAGEIKNATHDSKGNLLTEYEKAQIETYALVPAYNRDTILGSTVTNTIKTLLSNITGSAKNTFTNIIGGFFGGFSFDNIQNTVGAITGETLSNLDTDTPLLQLFDGLPEYDADGKLNQVKATNNELYTEAGNVWPPIISGFTKKITDKNGNTLAVKSCGCDEETECCYDAQGNYHYEYKGYNEIRNVGPDSNPHYQRLELSDNPYYNENRDQGLLVNASNKLRSFMQTTTRDVVKCKSYHINTDYVCTQDDYQEISSGQFIESVPNRADYDASGNENRTSDSWMRILSRGGQTGVGYSILPESMKTLRYRGIDIVCADAYKVTYPGIQDSGEKGQFIAMSNNNAYLTYNIDYDNKTAATKAPVVKIELKKTCVTTKGLSQRTFNLDELIENQANYLSQHAFFKNYLNYANLFGIDLDENQTSDPERRQQIADNITEYITGGDNPVVKARIYYDDYTTAFKDPKGYIDLELKAIKCPNIHKEFIEFNVDNETGKRDVSDLGIYCSDKDGYEIPNSDDSKSTPVYACSDTDLASLQNASGNDYFSRMWAQCVAIPAADEYADTNNTATILGEKITQLWYDFLNGEWTVKDFFTKSESIVLYGTIPQTLVKGGTAITCMEGYCKNNPFDSEVVSLPNNSLPIGFDTTSGHKKYRIEVDIDMSKTRKMPTFQSARPKQIPETMWNKWKSQTGASAIRDYGLAEYNKNNTLTTNKQNVVNPVSKKTVSSDGYLNNGTDTSKYTCSYSVDEELGNVNYFYRTISLSNINPQGRKLGSNWDYSNLNSTKGKYDGLIQRIDAQRAKTLVGPTNDSEEDSLFAKADNYQVLTGKDKFTFKLTAPTMRMIRHYNKLKMSSVGEGRRGYSDWTLNVVDYDGEVKTADDQIISVFTNTDASTKWTVGLKDTSSASSTTIPDYVYRRYNSQLNEIGYHWYSPFLWCLYYGGEYCTNVTSPVKSVTYDDARVKNDIKNTFSEYVSISNQGSEWDLRENIKKLIVKQNKLDNDSYKAVTTTSELVISDARTTAIHLGPKHEATLVDFTTHIGAYIVQFGGLLVGVDTSGLVNAGGSVLGKLIGAATGFNPYDLTTQQAGSVDGVLKGVSNALGDWFTSGVFGQVIEQIAKTAEQNH